MTDRNHPFRVRSSVLSIDRSFHLARRVCLHGGYVARLTYVTREEGEGGREGEKGREGGRRGVDRERGGKVRELESSSGRRVYIEEWITFMHLSIY